MTSSVLSIAVGADGIGMLHMRELPQKDNLCGCFWAAIALRAAGIEETGGDSIDQDRVAFEAGTILPADTRGNFVPPGAAPRRDYRLSLPVTRDAGAAGTSAPGLVRALERLAGGRLVVLAVAGPWSGASVVDLVGTTAALAPATTLVANIRSGRLWGSRPHPRALLDHLAGRDADGPPAEWDVGHFVNLAALVRGPRRALVVVRDSYRSLGWDGYHLQPADVVARALERGDGREGGVLCICPAGDAEALGAQLLEGGYELRHWDNGTPEAATDA
ncbi:MAG: hypothetical protein M3312_07380 [Actinomycetota bacterium]|nr:hypothetical protein [Actinomycetota bacterium]